MVNFDCFVEIFGCFLIVTKLCMEESSVAIEKGVVRFCLNAEGDDVKSLLIIPLFEGLRSSNKQFLNLHNNNIIVLIL